MNQDELVGISDDELAALPETTTMTETETMTTDATETSLHTLTISEVVEYLPIDCDWRIVDSKLANVTTCTGRKGRIFWDDQDPVNPGWAFQLAESDRQPEESGKLNDVDDVTNVFAF